MSAAASVQEFDSEPIRGLPEALPLGEQILWQGSPEARSLARRVFLVRWVAGYFALVLVGRVMLALLDGQGASAVAAVVAFTVLPALLCVGLLHGLAWLNARAAVYTLTNRRLVMRFGIAFPIAVNLPFDAIESADLRLAPDGTGDLAVSVRDAGGIAFWMMWPHVRILSAAGGLSPVLRSVPDARAVADLLGSALARSMDPVRRFVEADLPRHAALSIDEGPAASLAS